MLFLPRDDETICSEEVGIRMHTGRTLQQWSRHLLCISGGAVGPMTSRWYKPLTFPSSSCARAFCIYLTSVRGELSPSNLKLWEVVT